MNESDRDGSKDVSLSISRKELLRSKLNSITLMKLIMKLVTSTLIIMRNKITEENKEFIHNEGNNINQDNWNFNYLKKIVN